MDLQFTAVFRQVPEGYIGFVEELPGANTQGATLEEARANVSARVPLRRFASKDEIADLALFLSSDAAAYITGSIVVCDGGQSLSGHSLGLA